jgi:hypothetical protein
VKIKVCKTVVEPRHVLIGSKTDDSLAHLVIPSTIWNDPICDCRGYLFRGTCSHIDQTQSDMCLWWTTDLSYDSPCEYCGSAVVEFETDPEYD